MSMAYGWEGERVRLAPFDQNRHLETSQRWINDPAVTEWLLAGDTPVSMLMERDWLERVSRGSETEVAFAIETLGGDHIGNTALHRIDWRHGVANTGSLIGERELWGQGYGTEAARLRAHYAFHVLGLRMLLSGHLDGNVGSERMQRKAGYVEIGRVPRRYWKRGAYRDEILTALTRERWEELNRTRQ